MSGDPEFEDFLKRRRPLFRRDVDDGLEPPAELDRIVLRQARQAIEGEKPLRMLDMPRWAAPVAIAATLVLGLSVVFKTAMPLKDRVPEVTVEPVSQRMEYPQAAEMAAPALPAPIPDESPRNAIVVDLAAPPAGGTPLPAPDAARSEVAKTLRTGAPMVTAADAASPDMPAWRQDARSWQAEIERLRASGDTARADLEQTEFNRQHRALAVSPDR
jgi:hypothetical protein